MIERLLVMNPKVAQGVVVQRDPATQPDVGQGFHTQSRHAARTGLALNRAYIHTATKIFGSVAGLPAYLPRPRRQYRTPTSPPVRPTPIPAHQVVGWQQVPQMRRHRNHIFTIGLPQAQRPTVNDCDGRRCPCSIHRDYPPHSKMTPSIRYLVFVPPNTCPRSWIFSQTLI